MIQSFSNLDPGAGGSDGPSVSVIIPTYNRAHYLREAIQSVLSQTFTDYEVIVIDDGSTDSTEKVIKGFPGIRYVRSSSNSGVSRARNHGVGLARGRYLCFLDSDDLWIKDKLKVQMEWMLTHPDCRVSYTDEIWIRNGVRVNAMNKHRKYSGDIFKFCLPLCIVSPSSVMMQTPLILAMGGFDEDMPVCEDYDLWLRIAIKVPFHFIDQKLIVKQGGHSDQLSRKFWGMDRFRVHALIKLLEKNSLQGKELNLTLQTLAEKCDILVKGFSKRGKTKDALYYRTLIEKYSSKSFC